MILRTSYIIFLKYIVSWGFKPFINYSRRYLNRKGGIMLFLYFVLFVCLCLGIIIGKNKNDYLNPISAFIIPITLSVLCYHLFISYEYSISNNTIVIYCVGCFMYVFGVVVGQMNFCFKREKYKEKTFDSIYLSPFVDNLFKIFTVVLTIYIMYYLFTTAVSSVFSSSFINNLRYESIFGKGVPSIITYGMVFVTLYTNIKLYNYYVANTYTNKYFIYFLIFVLFLNVCITMAKTAILTLIITIYYIKNFKNARNYSSRFTLKKIISKYKNIFIYGGLLILLSYVIALGTNRAGSLNFFSKDFFIISYLADPIQYFDRVILNFSSVGNGYYSFGFFGRFFSQINLYTPIKFEHFFNMMSLYGKDGVVFGFAAPLFFDFGLIGVGINMLVNGLFVGYIYKKNIRNNGYWTIIYTSCLYSCIMAFFDYQFMMSDQLYTMIIILFIVIMQNNGKILLKRRKV